MAEDINKPPQRPTAPATPATPAQPAEPTKPTHPTTPAAANKPEPRKASDKKEGKAGSKLTSQSSSVAKINKDGYPVLSNVVRDGETPVHEHDGEVKHPAVERRAAAKKDGKASRPKSHSSSYVKVRKDGSHALTNRLSKDEKTLAEEEEK